MIGCVDFEKLDQGILTICALALDERVLNRATLIAACNSDEMGTWHDF